VESSEPDLENCPEREEVRQDGWPLVDRFVRWPRTELQSRGGGKGPGFTPRLSTVHNQGWKVLSYFIEEHTKVENSYLTEGFEGTPCTWLIKTWPNN
jgi:hypothetical protein